MNSKIIKEWLDNISTRTGNSVSGDMTLSYDKTEKIIDYITNLENALDEIEKYIIQQQDEQSERAGFYNVFSEYITINVDNLLEIIKKAKGE